nr:MAG TPA: tail tape measure [Caudoviricetes sp.]
MADSALGSALIIPESALKKIKEADDKLQQLQRTAEQTASSVKNSFGTMQGSTSGFIGALDQIIQKLGTIDNASSKMSGSLSNIGANKASKDVSQMNGVIIQASENIDRMVASQRKATNSADFSKSVSDWQNIQAQIDATNKRQQELTQSMRQYEMVQKNIRDGKGGIVYKDDKIAYAANQKEFESNQQLIASLREKQQAIIANNQALNQQIQLLNSLKSYHVDSGSLDNLRSKDTLASMREYYKEQEKLSAQQERQRQKDANAWLKNKEKEAHAAEKASKREQEASDKAAAKAEKDASRIRAAQEKAYMKDWLKQQRSAFYSNTNAVIADTNGAKTLRDHIAAIKELQQARLSLNTTDKNYKQNLTSVNEAIKQHSKVLKEAGVNAKNLGEQTSYIAGYLSRLAQRTAVVFSFGAAKSFVEQIAEVRGQFELSERSLEAILQNKPKADEIFNKTVELAVKSPFRIKDLVDYTRQLSAYRIESDKLYDTTKRLADVSAGLGVDMGRLILAYGQVKAAAYLRGSEVRQFTEAGINMYGELQQYFKEVKGEAYTTAQIVDMISKRKVTFEDVEAIFQRMTDKGGTFYNMQEIQAETLQGKISNLKDAFDVMLNDIGKANEGTFKGMISGATELLKHWESIKNVGIAIASVLSIMYLQSKKTGVAFSAMFTSNVAANATKNLTTWNLITSGIKSAGAAALTFGKNLKYALASNIYTIAIAAVFSALYKLYSLYSDYNEQIEKINAEHVKEKSEVFDLARQYTELGKAIDDASSKEQNYSRTDAIEKKRVIIEKLIKSLNDKGFDIKLNVLGLNEHELDETFRTLQAKLLQFQDLVVKARRKIAENPDGFFSDGITTDANQYNDAIDEMLSNTEKIDQAVNILKINYQSLNGTAKEYLHSVKQNKEDYADELEYYKAMQDAIRKVIQLSGEGSGIWEQLVPLQKLYSGLFADITSKAEEFDKELETSLGWLNKIADKKIVELILDTVAAEEGWNSWSKKHAKEYFKVTARLDTTQAKNDIASIKEQMDKAFANNTYHITFTYDPIKLDPKSAYGEFDAEAQEQLKKLQELVTKRHNLKGGSMKLAGYNEAATTREINDLYKDISQLGQGYKEAADRIMGYNKTRKNTTKHDKAQRDILNERISLLKEMNKQYEQLDKYMDDDSASQSVMKQYAANLKYVGMPDEIVKSFVPDKQGLIQALKQIEPTIKDFKKRAQLKNDIVELQIQLDTEFFQQQLNDVKNEISKSFDQLNLYKKLQGEGLSDGLIKSMFGDLTSSFDDVRKGIEDQFTAKFGNNTKWSSDIWKQYQEQMDKLDKEVYQDQVNQAQELIKAYKQQLSDQLQLDKWYIEEKQKIQNNANISKNKDLQKQLQDNLDNQYAQKTDANSWKDFQNSDMYISIFENLDHTSNRVLTAMKARLEGLRSSLKNLTPEQLKQIVEQINKIDALLVERNPYSNIGKNFKEYLKFAKQRKKLEEEYIDATQKEQILKNDQSNANKDVQNAEIAYNNAEKKYGVASKEAIQARILWDIDKERLRTITDQLVAQGKITEKQAEQIRNGQKLQKTLQQQVQTIGKNFSDAASSVTELFDALNDWGANIEMSDEMSEVVDGLSKIGSSLESIDITRPFSIIKGTIGTIGGIGKTIGGIFGWGTKDKKLQKQIENHQKAIEKLQERYSDLKDAIDNAFNIKQLAQYNDEMVKNLKAQNANLESMIKAEQDKKKTDNDKIEEYRKQIEANNKAIEEAEQSLTEQLGGFGTKANYKSAAEEFAKAWVDAYNEGSDALEALNDKFDEYIQNLIVKQATQRFVGNMVEPLLKKIDNAVKQGSEGGNNGLDLVKAELDDIMTTGKDKLKGVSDMLKSFVDGLGYKPKGSSNISALQQGIQSVTESTAQALESILNSCRWYIAQQQADIRIIRDTLLEKLGNSISAITQDTSSSPVLIELRLQTTILTDIRDTLASCVKGGHKQGRNGIKVFMN